MANVDKDVNEIKEWIQTQLFLPKDLNDAFIRTFLRGCEEDKEKAKQVLSNYFSARQSIPEIFTNTDPSLEENILAWKNSCYVPLSGKQNGCRVYLGVTLNSENYNFVALVKQAFMCYDLLIHNNEWENGDRIVIVSYGNVKRRHLASYNMYITRKVIQCEKDNYLPGKLRALHYVHLPPFMKKINERFRPYLNVEDKKVIQFHKTLMSLHKYVNTDILPLEFGGTAGSLIEIADKWYKYMLSQKNFFVQQEKKRMEESKGKVGIVRV